MNFEVNQKVKCIRPGRCFVYYTSFVKNSLSIMQEKWHSGKTMIAGENGIIVFRSKHPDKDCFINVVQTEEGWIFLMSDKGIKAL